jgi:3',5'-cyclic AMP phosphodiesterase CpdA
MRRPIPILSLTAAALILFWPPHLASQVQPPVNTDSLRLAVIGDMGTGEQNQYDLAKQMANARKVFPFAFVITLGDNIYGSEGAGDFERKFAIPYKPLLDAGVKFYASLGNHDDPKERFYAPYNMSGNAYYTYKKDNVRFFALDSDYMDARQLAWLEAELKNSGSDWKVCYFHHPLYSAGKTHGPSIDLRHLLEPLFVKYGVDLVLNGHEHFYERIKPQNGIYYFIEGASGELRPNDLNESNITANGFDTDNTFMVLEFAGDQLNFQTISRSGKVVDSGTIMRLRTTESKGSTSASGASAISSAVSVDHNPASSVTPP